VLACITLVAALSAASAALPPTTVAQASPRPATPQPAPSGRTPGHGSHHGSGSNGRYGPGVLIDARSYLATPNPQKTPFRNTTHTTIPAGEDVFSSQSTNGR